MVPTVDKQETTHRGAICIISMIGTRGPTIAAPRNHEKKVKHRPGVVPRRE